MNDSDKESPARDIAELIVDLLVDAGIVKAVSHDRAVKIVTKEIEAQAEIDAITLRKS